MFLWARESASIESPGRNRRKIKNIKKRNIAFFRSTAGLKNQSNRFLFMINAVYWKKRMTNYLPPA